MVFAFLPVACLVPSAQRQDQGQYCRICHRGRKILIQTDVPMGRALLPATTRVPIVLMGSNVSALA
jgi:hypothetical protein